MGKCGSVIRDTPPLQDLILQKSDHQPPQMSAPGFRDNIDADLPHDRAVAAGTCHGQDLAVPGSGYSDLVRRRVDPMVVLGQISRLISDLVSVSCLLEEGTPPTGVAAALGMNEYKAKLYVQSAGKRRPEQFRLLLKECREMDLASKRGADPLIQIERFLATASANGGR